MACSLPVSTITCWAYPWQKPLLKSALDMVKQVLKVYILILLLGRTKDCLLLPDLNDGLRVFVMFNDVFSETAAHEQTLLIAFLI